MGRRGPGALPQSEKREQFARLIAPGCRTRRRAGSSGSTARTGKRWRHGRTITGSGRPAAALSACDHAAADRREISDAVPVRGRAGA